jgi:hypothetical protein
MKKEPEVVNNSVTTAPLSPKVKVELFHTPLPMGRCNIDIWGKGGEWCQKDETVKGQKWPFLKEFWSCVSSTVMVLGSKPPDAMYPGRGSVGRGKREPGCARQQSYRII